MREMGGAPRVTLNGSFFRQFRVRELAFKQPWKKLEVRMHVSM